MDRHFLAVFVALALLLAPGLLFVTLLLPSSRPLASDSGSAIDPAFVSVSANGGCATIRWAIDEYDVVLYVML